MLTLQLLLHYVFQDLQDNLEANVQKHTALRDSVTQFKSWIQGENEKLDKCDDMTGEKVELVQRLEACKMIKANVEPGKRKLEALKALSMQVGQSTTKKGNAMIKKDLDEVEAAFNEHSEHISEYLFFMTVPLPSKLSLKH